MQRTPDPIIAYDSPEAAQPATVSGWMGRGGHFVPDSHPQAEDMARYAGCTHRKCECGELGPKYRTMCEACSAKARRAKYETMPIVEWDGKCMLTDYDGDQFWSNPEDFLEWCDNEDIADPTTIMVVATCPVSFREVETDYWEEELPDDRELPDDIQVALDALNKVIREHGRPACWAMAAERIDVAKLVAANQAETGGGA